MERNYFEKLHQNDMKSKSDIQVTLIFDISKTYQSEIFATSFCLSKTHQNKHAQIISFFHQKLHQKLHQNNVEILAHRNPIEQSTLKRR